MAKRYGLTPLLACCIGRHATLTAMRQYPSSEDALIAFALGGSAAITAVLLARDAGYYAWQYAQQCLLPSTPIQKYDVFERTQP